MNFRKLGKTGWHVSELSLGTWQVGGRWGEPFDAGNAEQILHDAVAAGVNFIDTADVYGDGESEKAVGRLLNSTRERIYVATKCGRRLSPHTGPAYTPAALRGFVEDSLKNLQRETIDLIQLHCPPTEVYYRPEIFGLFEDLQREGKVRHLGVSVEKVEEALKAIEYPNVTTVQIIFNMFRLRPSELFFREAAKRDIGIIARVPLASGLLSGKFGHATAFAKADHRHFNRNGESFDKGETFSGVDYSRGLNAVEALRKIFPDTPLALAALRWILMFPEVSCVIPGASNPAQLHQNLQAMDLPPLTDDQMRAVREVYDTFVRNPVHHTW